MKVRTLLLYTSSAILTWILATNVVVPFLSGGGHGHSSHHNVSTDNSGGVHIDTSAEAWVTRDRFNWHNHRYIFIGGLHGCGTSVVERLISSQWFASGMDVSGTVVPDRAACHRLDRMSPTRCIAPQNEGSFVTRAFQLYINNDLDATAAFDAAAKRKYGNSVQGCAQDNLLFSWGHCVSAAHISAFDLEQVRVQQILAERRRDLAQKGWLSVMYRWVWPEEGHQGSSERDYVALTAASATSSRPPVASTDAYSAENRPSFNPPGGYFSRKANAHNKILCSFSDFRDRLLTDWGLFWNTGAPYLVEKDIANGVRGLLLQEIFGGAANENTPDPSQGAFQVGSWLPGWTNERQSRHPRSSSGAAFIYVLRHPLAGCRQLQCKERILQHIVGWLRYYDTLVSDLPLLSHYAVVHYEGLVGRHYANQEVVSAIRRVLGWEGLPFSYHFDGRRVDIAGATKRKANATAMELKSRRVSRRLGFRAYDETGVGLSAKVTVSSAVGGGGNAKTKSKVDVVVVRQSEESVAWEMEYEHTLIQLANSDPALYRKLHSYEAALNKFCYSLLTLRPVCTVTGKLDLPGTTTSPTSERLRYVYRQSSRGMEALSIEERSQRR